MKHIKLIFGLATVVTAGIYDSRAQNANSISQQAYLKASNTGASDYFGWSVAVSYDTVVVGAPGEDSNARGVNGSQSNNSLSFAGAAYVFVRSGTNWSQQAYLKASNTDALDDFGASVAASGDTVVVGTYNESSNATGVNGDQNDNSATSSGAAYVFVRNGTNWSQQAYLKASNTGAGDEFTGFSGRGLAISGDTIVVGSSHEGSDGIGVNGDQSNNNALDSGAAYIFVRSGTNWSQQAYLKASNAEAGDEFGDRVDVSGDLLVVATGGESSNATGINGTQSDNSAPIAGAAYVLVRSGTNWTQQAYLKASNTEAFDEFGSMIAVSGDTLVVAAVSESSSATGVNGNQSDNSAPQSGAVYVFTGFGVGARLALAPDGSGGYFISFKGIPDLTYRLQRAPSVTGLWDTVATLIAPASGVLEYHETSSLPDTAFYRTVQR